MDNPSNYDEEISKLRNRIEDQVNKGAIPIVEKAIQEILGRIRFVISRDLSHPEIISWFIDPTSKKESKE